MSDITLTPTWEAGIYQLETTDPIMGGLDGISNRQANQLGNRTEYLRQVTDDHETRVTELESSSEVTVNSVGSGTFVRHGIITGKHQTGSLTAVPNFLSLNTSAKTVTLVASYSEPFVASISRGFNVTSPLIDYVYLYFNKVANYSIASDKLCYIKMIGGVPNLLLEDWITPVYSFVAPSGTVAGRRWYNLRTHKSYVQDSGGGWGEDNVLLLAKIVPGDDQIIYLTPVGKSVDTRFGISAVPSGTVHVFAGTASSVPEGYLLCDGGAISRTTYSYLYNAIGTTYGSGDGSTTFNLPDLRGEFIRGLDGGRGIDTDTVVITGNTTNGSATISNMETTYGLTVGMSVSGTGIPAGATIASIVSRKSITISANATATGSTVSLTFSRTRTLGSNQAHMVHKHDHMINTTLVGAGSGTTAALGDTNTTGNLTQMTGGSETRPRNVAMNYIIKF